MEITIILMKLQISLYTGSYDEDLFAENLQPKVIGIWD